MSELLWIAVPGGDTGGGPLLRVVVVPRLDPGTLADAGMAAWPPRSLLEGRSIVLQWRDDAETTIMDAPVPPDDLRITADGGLWTRMFRPDLPVGTGRRGGAAVSDVEVRRTSEQATRIDRTFAGPVATVVNPEEPTPPGFAEQVISGLEPWAGDRDHAPRRAPRTAAPAEPPTFDRTISLLREHPAVLRALGLAFDIRATPPFPTGSVKVLWLGADPGLPAIVSPWTAYGRGFLPRSTGSIRAGMVALRPDASGPLPPSGSWSVVTVDVDGGVGRLRDAAAALVPSGTEPGARRTPSAVVSLPAMRSAGLQLVREGRAAHLNDRRGRAEGITARGDLNAETLDADDLVLGYRIDIRRGGGEWQSLHERMASYFVDGTAIPMPDSIEEGHIKANAVVREEDGTITADEVVARWSGWSLAVTRPRFDAPAGRAMPVRRAGLPFDFDWSYDVPRGRLPSLRFTATYDLRARVVDLAGRGLELQDSDADRCAITDIPYRRLEPVASPGLEMPDGVRPAMLGPSEGVDVLVIRSAPPDVGVDDFGTVNPGYTAHPQRLLRRPGASMTIAEQHGMLDRPGLDDEKTFTWLQRALEAANTAPDRDPDREPLPDPAAGGVRAFPRREPGAPLASPTPRAWVEPWPEPSDPKLLALRDRKEGESALQWEGDTLVVRLAPAEQITLELSSTLTENFLDHFALQEGMPALSRSAAEAGRHPLITPAQPITLVHAVRQPLTAPADVQLVTVPREAGQTFAELQGPATLRDLGVDVQSTAQVDLSATWTERADDRTEQVIAPIQSVVVDRGDVSLKDALRHELGDTRHREIRYSITAVTRFRQFFDQLEDQSRFVRRTTLSRAVNVRSTARPSPPTVLATRPAFAFSEFPMATAEGVPGVSRERSGGRLRLELARPWYQTGDGERLAVVLWDRSGDAPPADLRPFITQIGRDPIWVTSDPERWPLAADLLGAAGPARTTTLPDSLQQVLVVPYEPWFHVDRWYVDVAFGPTGSYCPVVQLAVARYQPDSIDGLDLSQVVVTEMVPLLPTRELTIENAGSAIRVALNGLGPEGGVPNRVDIVLEHCELPTGMGPEAVDLTTFEPSPGGVTAWMQVPGVPARSTTLNADAIEIPVPPGLGPIRVRVREVELIGADVGTPAAEAGTPRELTERVVFVDTVMPPV
jgi:hypothetical protein